MLAIAPSAGSAERLSGQHDDELFHVWRFWLANALKGGKLHTGKKAVELFRAHDERRAGWDCLFCYQRQMRFVAPRIIILLVISLPGGAEIRGLSGQASSAPLASVSLKRRA